MGAWTSSLAAALTRHRGASVRGGAEVDRLLEEHVVDADCPARSDCVEALRARVGPGPIVFLVLTRLADKVQIEPTIDEAGDLHAPAPIRGSPELLASIDWWYERTAGWLPVVALLPGPEPSTEAAGPSPTLVAPGPPPPRWGTLVAGGLGVVALGVAVGFGVDAMNAEQTLVDRGCLEVRCADADIEAVERGARTADVLYGVGAAGVLTAVALYLFADVPSARARPGAVARF